MKHEEVIKFLGTKFRAAIWRAETVLMQSNRPGWYMIRSAECPSDTSEIYHHTLTIRPRPKDEDEGPFCDSCVYVRISFSFPSKYEKDKRVSIQSIIEYWKRHPVTKYMCGSSIEPAKLEIDLNTDLYMEVLELMTSHLVESLAEECTRSWDSIRRHVLGLEPTC